MQCDISQNNLLQSVENKRYDLSDFAILKSDLITVGYNGCNTLHDMKHISFQYYFPLISCNRSIPLFPTFSHGGDAVWPFVARSSSTCSLPSSRLKTVLFRLSTSIFRVKIQDKTWSRTKYVI